MLYNLIEKNPLQAETQHLGFQAKTNISLLKIAAVLSVHCSTIHNGQDMEAT